jgi:NAD(P)H-dependent FMN reductase
MTARILAFAGSLRRESFSKKLVPIAVKGARYAGALVTQIDLRDFPLPLFDQDLEAEQGMPENGKQLKQLFIDHGGLLLACPEYNSSVTPVLKTPSIGCRGRRPVSPRWWRSGARSRRS